VRTSAKTDHELSLVNSKALIALKYYLDYEEYEDGKKGLQLLIKQYPGNKEEVVTGIKKAFFYITKHRYEGEIISKNKPPSSEAIAIMKSDVNELLGKSKKVKSEA
jgi:hypothetical protein